MEIQESAITLAGFFPSGDSDGHSSLERPLLKKPALEGTGYFYRKIP